ncbi:MAG: Wzz/FepE/Etk N-terminal domain-containing protein [Eubacteriales bacterium]
MEITLQQIVKLIWRWWWIIALATLVCAAGAFGISRYLITPQYSASTLLYVSNQKEDQPLSASDLTISQKLINTYAVILTSRTVLSEVKDNVSVDYSIEEIKKMISASAVNQTEVFQITVTCASPEDAILIANAVATYGTPEILRIVKAGSVEVVEEAHASPKTAPHTAKNSVLGALLGLMLSVGLLVLADVFDTRIKTENDLVEISNIPIIGVIPYIDKPDHKAASYGTVS